MITNWVVMDVNVSQLVMNWMLVNNELDDSNELYNNGCKLDHN